MTALYRHYDANGALLYVGITMDIIRRLRQHENSDWYGQISRITIEHHDSRETALLAEREAVNSENPEHNVLRMLFEPPPLMPPGEPCPTCGVKYRPRMSDAERQRRYRERQRARK